MIPLHTGLEGSAWEKSGTKDGQNRSFMLTLPQRNMRLAHVDVYASGHGCEEFWCAHPSLSAAATRRAHAWWVQRAGALSRSLAHAHPRAGCCELGAVACPRPLSSLRRLVTTPPPSFLSLPTGTPTCRTRTTSPTRARAAAARTARCSCTSTASSPARSTPSPSSTRAASAHCSGGRSPASVRHLVPRRTPETRAAPRAACRTRPSSDCSARPSPLTPCPPPPWGRLVQRAAVPLRHHALPRAAQ